MYCIQLSFIQLIINFCRNQIKERLPEKYGRSENQQPFFIKTPILLVMNNMRILSFSMICVSV